MCDPHVAPCAATRCSLTGARPDVLARRMIAPSVLFSLAVDETFLFFVFF